MHARVLIIFSSSRWRICHQNKFALLVDNLHIIIIVMIIIADIITVTVVIIITILP